MDTFFRINYEFDKRSVLAAIDNRLKESGSDYICVADGVILNTANRSDDYLKVINGGMFSICDSSFVPLYIRLLYGDHYDQYCGSQIFKDVVASRKYRMIFMGTQQNVLDALQSNLSTLNPDVRDMKFVELPFRDVEDFDYPSIARMIEKDGADIIWIALGAPKQEIFMSKLKPHLHHGVMIAVGAAFKFYSGIGEKRAPRWMVKHHLEFVHRLFMEPRKQVSRCSWIIRTLPGILWEEYQRKNNGELAAVYDNETQSFSDAG